MEPIPESLEALKELAKYGDATLMKTVRRISVDVAKIVPDLVGLSFAVVGENMTITLVASDPLVADLDAVQYLDDGPCVHATGHGSGHHLPRRRPTRRGHVERVRAGHQRERRCFHTLAAHGP